MPNGPKRNIPAPRSSRLANTLAESKRGTQSQSTEPSGASSAPVWQLDKNAYSAIGVNGEGNAALSWWDVDPFETAAVRDLRVAIVTSSGSRNRDLVRRPRATAVGRGIAST